MAHHESESLPMQLDTSQCSAPVAGGLQHFEGLLHFSLPNNGNGRIHGRGQKPPRQLACTRCHAHKLRCVRQSPDEPTCDRCLAVDVECIARALKRMGRPVDHHNSTISDARSQHKSRQGRTSQRKVPANGSGRRHLANEDRGTTPLSPPTIGQPTSASVSLNDNDTTIDMSEDIPVEDNGSRNNHSNVNLMAQFPQTLVAASDLDVWSSWPSYANSLMADLEGPNSLLPNLEDSAETLLCHGPGFELNFNSNDPINLHTPSDASVDDPIEQLSKFHLELYQCLTSVKAVEKLKQQKLRDVSKQVEEIDTSWLQDLFRTTERFIDALTGYVSKISTTIIGTTTPNDVVSESGDGQEPNSTIEIDSATGLMIVSCYMRLLQILEVVVFIIETYRDFDCPGSYVEVQFGSFIPKTDKALSTRLLGQYVLHLLNGISGAANKAIASHPPYARVLVETRRVESNLRERISTALH